jgi:acyl carrier protein
MTNEHVYTSLREMVQQVAQQQVEIAPSDNLFKLALLDSVLLIDLVQRIERAFGIRVADREMAPDNFLTLERMTFFVNGRLNEGSREGEAALQRGSLT